LDCRNQHGEGAAIAVQRAVEALTQPAKR